MIQDIGFEKLKNEYHPEPPKSESRIMIFHHGKLLCRINEEMQIAYPKYSEWSENKADEGTLIYLFSIGEDTYYLLSVAQKIEIDGYVYEKMFRLRRTFPERERFAGVSAYHLYTWYANNHFCGKCGTKLLRDSKERKLQCPVCGNEVFPRINPAVIVAVSHGNQLILTKYAGREYKKYALIAGFAEFGETIEQTVQREVMEEVGIRVKNLRYYKSQPWGFSGSLLFGFFAEADGDLTIHRQEDELAEAMWVPAEEIVLDSEEISLTREMMQVFQKEHCENGEEIVNKS